MPFFDYTGTPYSVRPEIVEANRNAWQGLSEPGSWWSGAERIAIAQEVRSARTCRLCAERKNAISPEAIQGDHDSRSSLPGEVIEAIHRITTDAGRLSRAFYDRVTAHPGFSDGHYVEMLGVLVTVVSLDSFHRGLGRPDEPLPEPIAGEPSGYRPALATDQGAYVPMIPVDGAVGDEADLWEGERGGNVTRAMSLVPDEVRQMLKLSAAYYLPLDILPSPTAHGNRAINREQIEFLASRVSALNECFY